MNTPLHPTFILREINLAISDRAGCISDSLIEWEIILFLSSRYTISVSVLTDKVCVRFVPRGQNQKVP